MPRRRRDEDDELWAMRRVLEILAKLNPNARLAAARYVLAKVAWDVRQTRDLVSGVIGGDPKSRPGDDD